MSDSKWKYPGRSNVRFEDVTSSCGLFNNGLSILAIGDFNSDRYDDYFILNDNDNSVSVYLWNRNDFKFEAQESTKIAYNSSIKVLNAIPSDYNRDGKLDVLISFKNAKDSSSDNLWYHEIYLGAHTSWKEKSIEKLTFTSKTQLTLLDMNGTFNVDLFGQNVDEEYGFYSPHAVLESRNSWTLLPSCPLNDPSSDLKISEYHSSAFVDIDGDGRADFLVPCESSKSMNSISLMIFLNLGNQLSLAYHSTISLSPKPISTLSFGDFDGNGSIDMIYASDQGLHVFFNKQRPYCYSSKDVIDDCKSRKSCLFERDTIFGYDANIDNNSFRLDISNIKLFNNDKLKILGYDYLGAPISLHVGDIQYDGYPDIACIVTSGKQDNNSIVVLKNVPIPDMPERHAYRTFVIDNTMAKVLSSSDSPWALSLVDLANDGVMDIIVNAKDTSSNINKIIALRSMYYVDAFFINIVVTNGICQAHCSKGEMNPKPKVIMLYIISQHNQYFVALWCQLSWGLIQVIICRCGRISSSSNRVSVFSICKNDPHVSITVFGTW